MEDLEVRYLKKLHTRLLHVYWHWVSQDQKSKAEGMEQRFWLWWVEVGRPRLHSIFSCG